MIIVRRGRRHEVRRSVLPCFSDIEHQNHAVCTLVDVHKLSVQTWVFYRLDGENSLIIAKSGRFNDFIQNRIYLWGTHPICEGLAGIA